MSTNRSAEIASDLLEAESQLPLHSQRRRRIPLSDKNADSNTRGPDCIAPRWGRQLGEQTKQIAAQAATITIRDPDRACLSEHLGDGIRRHNYV
jgi:hypothetical protein